MLSMSSLCFALAGSLMVLQVYVRQGIHILTRGRAFKTEYCFVQLQIDQSRSYHRCSWVKFPPRFKGRVCCLLRFNIVACMLLACCKPPVHLQPLLRARACPTVYLMVTCASLNFCIDILQKN